jgi:hypothetical protein
MQAIKEILLHKLTLRLIYMATALSTSHIIAFLMSSYSQTILGHVFKDPTLQPGAKDYLEAAISSLLLMAGEFVYHFIHTNFILPHVKQTPSPSQ